MTERPRGFDLRQTTEIEQDRKWAKRADLNRWWFLDAVVVFPSRPSRFKIG
jgi:hypothetical protein